MRNGVKTLYLNIEKYISYIFLFYKNIIYNEKIFVDERYDGFGAQFQSKIFGILYADPGFNIL